MASKLLNDDDSDFAADFDFGELPEERHALYFIVPSSAMAMMSSSVGKNNLLVLFLVPSPCSSGQSNNDEKTAAD